MALWVRIACPFSAPPPDWRLIVAAHPRPLGCPLFCCFFGGCLLLLGCVPLLARVSSVASLFLPLCTGALGCAACGVCGCLPPFPLGCSRVASWPNQASAGLVPPSGYLVASCDGLVALPVAWSAVVLCFLASCCSTAAKAFGPVWGNWFTLYTLGHMLLWGFALLH